MDLKTETMWWSYMPIRMAKIKHRQNPMLINMCNREPLSHCWKECKQAIIILKKKGKRKLFPFTSKINKLASANSEMLLSTKRKYRTRLWSRENLNASLKHSQGEQATCCTVPNARDCRKGKTKKSVKCWVVS